MQKGYPKCLSIRALRYGTQFWYGNSPKTTVERILKLSSIPLVVCTDSRSLYDCLKLATSIECLQTNLSAISGTHTSPAIVDLRDFINEVGGDPSKPEQSTAMQIKASLNIPSLPLQETSDDFDQTYSFTRGVPYISLKANKVSHWGANFRTDYPRLNLLRTISGPSIP
jgi:hypothetical protein